MNVSHSIDRGLTHLFLSHASKFRPWLLVAHGCTWVELRHAWLHSGYTTVDAMLEIETTSATWNKRPKPLTITAYYLV